MEASLPPVDALFVVNQETDVSRIHDISRLEGFHSLLILSTHRPFRNEILEMQDAASHVEIRSFAEFLTDADMQSCDDRASSELLLYRGNPEILKTYFSRFMGKSLRNKNEIVSSRVVSKYGPRKVYYQEGLGVDAAVWGGCGGSALEAEGVKRFLRHNLRRIHRGLSGFINKRNLMTLVSDGSVCYVFLTSVRRLKFSNYARVHPIPFSFSQWLQFHISRNRRVALVHAILRQIPSSLGEPRLATTIHEYSYKLGDLGLPLHVFVDGFHPSNYPRSYVDHFSDHCIFMINHVFNAPWFERHRRKILPAMPFLQSPIMKPVSFSGSYPSKVILLALNHAGDWTALINRSDTDLLVEAFSDLAEELPDLTFIIRPHPTMATPGHEGIHSLERIKRYVFWRGIPNLSVSEQPLEHDMQRSNVFVSEYSQVLIDAFQVGKLGIIVNLTSRRSFMEDYENLGFLFVRTSEELRNLLARITEDSRPAVEVQNKAVDGYNTLLKEHGYC